jgi:hypothetical protein
LLRGLGPSIREEAPLIDFAPLPTHRTLR